MEAIPLLSEDMVVEHKNKDECKTVDTLKNLEVEMKLRGFSKQTSKTYLYYNSKFLEHTNKSPADIAEYDIKEFLAHKMSDSSNGSVNLIRAALKFYYSEILGKNISWIKTPREDKKLPVVLSKKEIKDLIDKTENVKHKLLMVSQWRYH